MFFFFKYYIDKNNLTFVYNKEFEGGGDIKSDVIPFLLFSIFLFQLLNIGYFALTFNYGFLIGGFILILLEVIGLCYIRAHYDKIRNKYN